MVFNLHLTFIFILHIYFLI